ncbi:MAG: DUF1684 domain-containing protein [Bacteroidota bacterium]
MKNQWIAFSLLLFTSLALQAQIDLIGYPDSIASYHAEQKEKFQDEVRSPLREGAAHFKGHDWFPTNPSFCVDATLRRTDEAKPFMMPTSNPDRSKPYVSYGIATFRLGEEVFELTVYKSLGLPALPQYRDYYFIPFQDQTNGEETYGGGRYLDIRLKDGQNQFVIDFNRCYNPYCAYTDGWSCPIPPKENRLTTRIEAGIKSYESKGH